MMIAASIPSGMPTAPVLAPVPGTARAPFGRHGYQPSITALPITSGASLSPIPAPTNQSRSLHGSAQAHRIVDSDRVAPNAPRYSAHSERHTAASFNPASMRRRPPSRSPPTPRRASQNPPIPR